VSAGLHGKLIRANADVRDMRARLRLSTIFVHICARLAHRRTRVIYAKARVEFIPLDGGPFLMHNRDALHLARALLAYRLLPLREKR